MPWKSKKQRAWGHATNQPFAEEWDKKTGKKKLPTRVKRKKKRGK